MLQTLTEASSHRLSIFTSSQATNGIMVRHKNRWLLVKVELAEDIRRNQNNDESLIIDVSSFPSKKEFTTRLRRTVGWCFGLEGDASCEVQVRFCDVETQLAVIRVPRDSCGKIRAALTLLLTRKQLLSLGEPTTAKDYQVSVVSVHGSARTLKVAIYRKLRKLYRFKIEKARKLFPDDKTLQTQLCRALQERLALVQNSMN